MSADEAPLTSTATFADPGKRQRRRIRAFRVTVDGGEPTVLRTPVSRAGREPENDVVVDDGAVSRAHLEIRADDVGYRLVDLSSHNGTVVDGVRANDTYLRDGSTIRIGRSVLRFEVLDEHADVPASDHERFGRIVGASLPMRELYARIELVAPTATSVLITGETGTGKELVAREIHDRSARAQGPYVVFDCAAVSPRLIESELFGHVAGAFTGARGAREGLVSAANGGTLFLDEVGELPLELQPKLLRVIQQREVRPIGATEVEEVDVRFVAATNRDLSREMNAGAFRADLFYRLAVLQLETPPLRERRDDVRLLVEHSVSEAAPDRAAEILAGVDDERWRELGKRPWRGNVRELRGWAMRALVIGIDEPLPALEASAPDPVAVDLDQPFSAQKQAVVASFEAAYLEAQLARHDHNISAAARASGLERMHFKRLLKKYR